MEPKRCFYIFSEGGKTEPKYFAAIKAAYAGALIAVETTPGVGVPISVAEAAIDKARDLGLKPRSRKPKNSYEKNDEVWAVFDRDDHPRFEDAIQRCCQAFVGVGYSIPCFELWLILHEEDCDRPDDRDAVQAKLAALRPEYDKRGAKTPNCADLVTRVAAAEARADRQLQRRRDQGSTDGNPSTTVGHLTRAIRDSAATAI